MFATMAQQKYTTYRALPVIKWSKISKTRENEQKEK